MTLDITLDPTIAEELTPSMYSNVNLLTDRTAYIIGNGQSRIGLDLELLGGDIWGCNALFRDYTPDYLTIVDVSIMGECCQTKYPKYNKCYFSGEWEDPLGHEEYNMIKGTMGVPVREWIDPSHSKVTMHGKGNGNIGILEMQAIGIEDDYKISSVGGPDDDYHLFENWFAGTTAAAMASMNHDYDSVVFVGFDSIWNYNSTKYNNIYAGTECYGTEDDPENNRLVETGEQGWISQTEQLKILLDRFQNIDYYIMKDELSVEPLEQYLV